MRFLILTGSIIVGLVGSFILRNHFQVSPDSKLHIDVARVQIPFIENRGQINSEVVFYAQTFAGPVFVTKNGEMVYSFQSNIFKESLVGAKESEIKGENQAVTKVSSFIGNDPNRWQKNMPTYQMVNIGQIYEGIALKLKSYGKNVEKLFFVEPGADPKRIKVKVDGAKDMRIDQNGEMVVTTDAGAVRFTKPVAYQEIEGMRTEVHVAYSLEKIKDSFAYGFKIGPYNKTCSLVIDPFIASTFIGGNLIDYATAIALGEDGTVYIAGYTNSASYPGNANPTGDYDTFISRFNSSLSQLLSSTFIGGDRVDTASSLTIDANGTVYVAGKTNSTNFPAIALPGDTKQNPGNAQDASDSDIFVAKFSGDLSQRQASIFFGGNVLDQALAMAVDGNEVYITGTTTSPDFPATSVTSNPNQTITGTDIFISKLDSDLSQRLQSVFIGGDDTDNAYSIALSSGSVYIAGDTASSNYPTTAQAYSSLFNGAPSAIVTELNRNDLSLMSSTFLDEQSTVFTLAVDSTSGDVFVAGQTSLSDYPTTDRAYDRLLDGPKDIFISRLSSDLTTLNASTFLGGANEESALALVINGDKVYVTGFTNSPNYPSMSTYINGNVYTSSDVFVSEFDINLSNILNSTILGGAVGDSGTALALNRKGNVYITGATVYSSFVNSNYPSTDVAYDTTINDSMDVFITKLSQEGTPSSLNAIALSSSRIVLTWKDLSSAERGFKIERKQGNCSDSYEYPYYGSSWRLIRKVPANTRIYKDTRLQGGASYSYRVRAYSAIRNSDYTDCVTVTTPVSGAPKPPTGLVAKSVSSSMIRLQWIDNSTNETKFRVFRRVGTGAWGELTPRNDANTVRRDDTNAVNYEITYSYYVKACRDSACSAPTNIAVVPRQPLLDVNVVATETGGDEVQKDVLCDWGKDLNRVDPKTTHYRIYKHQGGCGSQGADSGTFDRSKTSAIEKVDKEDIAIGYQVQAIYRSEGWPYSYGFSAKSNCEDDTTPDDPVPGESPPEDEE